MRIPALIFLFLVIFSLSTHHAFAAIQFLIFDPVISSLEISLTASISGLTSTSCNTENKCFLQGTLRQVGATKYFGQTLNNNNSWIDYLSSPELEYIQSTFLSFQPEVGSWSGQLKMRFSPTDEEYKGPGNYELKFRRFSGKSTSPTGDSNTLTLALTAIIPTPTPSPTSVPTPTSTPSPTTTPTPTPTSTPIITTVSPTPSPSPKKTPTSTSTPTIEETPNILAASDSSEITSAPLPALPTNQNNSIDTATFLGVAVATICLLLLAFWRLRKLNRLK